MIAESHVYYAVLATHVIAFVVEKLSHFFKKSVNLGKEKTEVRKVLSETTLDGVVEFIKSDQCKNVIVMCGAGISTCKPSAR